ncbi:MAG TPA: M15 family metallopeptidase, partial [Longimicrobiales bacterium]|nr:M15 family metallopeptidase [Longimicrobiales bacterium]
MGRPTVALTLCMAVAAACTSTGSAPRHEDAAAPLPREAPDFAAAFTSIADVDSTIIVEARYHGHHNFLGRPVAGYEAPLCLLTREAAAALAAVQAEIRPFGLGLKTWDCYRPQRAVDDFVAWARDTADTAMALEFYPAVPKGELFAEGYIAERSGHSRGSTVDLTLLPLRPDPFPPYQPGQPLRDCRGPADARTPDNGLDMGTAYDCFDLLSHTANPAVGPDAARNRLLLKAVMERHGFRNYAREWWHFTLRDEPWPDTY